MNYKNDIAAKIAAARALEAAATPGPWRWNEFALHTDTDHIIWPDNSSGELIDDEWAALMGAYGRHAERHAKDNADLIVHARNHHAALWDVVEAAESFRQFVINSCDNGVGELESRARLFAALAKLAEAT